MADRQDGPGAVERLMAALADVSAADLAAIDGLIAAKRAELDGLKAVRDTVRTRLGVVEERPPRRPRAKPTAPQSVSADGSVKVRVAKLLSVRGPLMPQAVASELESPYATVYQALQGDWFTKTAQGYHLNAVGRKGAGIG